MARLVRTPQALQDLDDIWFFIAQDNLTAADAWLDRLLDSVQILTDQPHMGRARTELGKDIRSLPVSAYMLYYRPIENGVELLRVLHSSRDIDTI